MQASEIDARAGADSDYGQARRHVRVELNRPSGFAGAAAMPAMPLKRGMKASGDAVGRFPDERPGQDERGGEREVYVLVRRDQKELETPVFRAGLQDDSEAVAVFFTREAAALFLQVSGWHHYRSENLTPSELSGWLQQAERDNVNSVLVQPNRQQQERGVEQPFLKLQDLPDLSGENLYREVQALAGR
jgi:hypothetical protein